MAKSFTAQLRDATKLTRKQIKYVAVSAIQDVVEKIQTPQPSVKITGGSFEEGKIPVDTSELINSLEVNGIVGQDSYVLALAGMKLGGVISFVWTAPQALPMETGYTKERADGSTFTVPGRHYVGANVPLFSLFVRQREQEVGG